MSLEQLTKPELVKELREANQNNKALQTEVEQLKKQVAELSDQKDNVGNSEQEASQLPYLAVSQFREAGGNGGRVIKLRFNLQGDAEIISNEKYSADYKVNFEAVKILETEIEKQIEVVESVQSNPEDDKDEN